MVGTLPSLLHLRGRFILFYLPREPPIGHLVLLFSGSGAGDSCGIEPVWAFSSFYSRASQNRGPMRAARRAAVFFLTQPKQRRP